MLHVVMGRSMSMADADAKDEELLADQAQLHSTAAILAEAQD